jgi:hypothetical protein
MRHYTYDVACTSITGDMIVIMCTDVIGPSGDSGDTWCLIMTASGTIGYIMSDVVKNNTQAVA